MTFLSSFTARTISGFSSVPELSLSILRGSRAVGDETRRRRTSRAVAATRASWKLNDGRRART